MTKAERILWGHLSRKQVNGVKFRRQYGIGRFIVDFYAPSIKLAIEVDGETHFSAAERQYDYERQLWIEAWGVRFLRFTNQAIFDDLERVLDKIRCNTPPNLP